MADSPYPYAREPQDYPPPRKGLSTGAKIAIGCGIAVLVVVVAVGIFLFFAGSFLSEQVGGFGAQREASETFERLAEQYPFVPPADGVVSDDQTRTFFTVTDEVWRDVSRYVDELNELVAKYRNESREGEFRDFMTGLQAMGRVLRARLALAEALERHRISNAEYVWTGITLMKAYEALGDPEAEPLPAANLALARRYESRLADMEPDDERIGKGLILYFISVLDVSEGLWKTLELDSADVQWQ